MLIAQTVGSAIVTFSTLAVSFAVMYAIDAMGLLRLSEEGEHDGMDIHEHGISAYPEYVISALSAPAGAPLKIPANRK